MVIEEDKFDNDMTFKKSEDKFEMQDFSSKNNESNKDNTPTVKNRSTLKPNSW